MSPFTIADSALPQYLSFSLSRQPVPLVPYASAPNDSTLSPRALAGLTSSLVLAQARADTLACLYWPLQLWAAMHVAAHRHGLADTLPQDEAVPAAAIAAPVSGTAAEEPKHATEEHKDDTHPGEPAAAASADTDAHAPAAPSEPAPAAQSPVAATSPASTSSSEPTSPAATAAAAPRRDVLDTAFVVVQPTQPGMLARHALRLERAWLRAVCGPAGEDEDGVQRWSEVLSYVDDVRFVFFLRGCLYDLFLVGYVSHLACNNRIFVSFSRFRMLVHKATVTSSSTSQSSSPPPPQR